MRNKYLRAVAILSVLGMLVTFYLIYQHYKPAGEGFCNVSDYVSCDVVNKSKYAEIFGVPVAAFGFAAYAIMAVAAFALYKGWLKERRVLGLLTLFAGISMVFALGLTYIEFVLLRAVCIFCITQQIIIIIIFITLLALWLKERKLSR